MTKKRQIAVICRFFHYLLSHQSKAYHKGRYLRCGKGMIYKIGRVIDTLPILC